MRPVTFPCRGIQGRQRTGRGFTLIELLVACALMAVLALLSWRGLDSILQTRERLVIASDELRSLTLAFSQMDEDLLKSWPISLLKLNEPNLRVAVAGEQNAQSLHLIREVNRSGFPTRVQRVVYEVRGRQLARGFSEYGRADLGAGGGGAINGGAVQSMVWQPILGGVRSLTIRGWVDGRGWMDASNLAGIEQARSRLNSAAAAASSGAGAASRAGSAGGAGSGAAAGVAANPASPGASAAQAAQAAALAAQAQFTLSGIEVVLERVDGQRFLRVYSVKD
ncbi:MAG TPA: prepilin-type N-terminal cleavage/methylation domain-containing protein [Lautropia sp.]|nr:prepilin-type N-terminal cleavage/methylation domain-containing protein [Lautropia sp.]